ncbi:hypothetical protein H312_00721 [Anncaliia algerae PRA339]|uniref:Uncharacterized protein n=1 Tax=Anncaliia algerae PRA339 TaxID=1288291 RepID=A0A059F3Z0_9MICR|nr:hypothetical protein H312_00721 [Anncaliia algerae PRA339]
MEDKEKIKELINDTIAYFYPKNGFAAEETESLLYLVENTNIPTERALTNLEQIIDSADFEFLEDNLMEEEQNMINKDNFYKSHKFKIDKINSLIYAKYMQNQEIRKKLNHEKFPSFIENSNALMSKQTNYDQKYVQTETIAMLFEGEKNLKRISFDSIEVIIKNLKNFSELEKILNEVFLPEEEVLSLLNLSEKLYKENNNLFVNVYFLLLTHLNTNESFNQVNNLEDMLDILEIYLFNNQINNNLPLFINILKVFRKIPQNNYKLINKIVNFIELLMKNIYVVDPIYKLECFNVLLKFKDKKGLFTFLLNDYEILDKQCINQVEIRLFMMCKLFEEFVICESNFNEQNYIAFSSQVFSFIKLDLLIDLIDSCPLSRMMVISSSVYFINTNFIQNLQYFEKILLKVNEILTNKNIKNISVKEEILYKHILKRNNLQQSLKFLFKQLIFHFLKHSKKSTKLLKVIFKTDPHNLDISSKTKKFLIQNLKNIFINLGYTLQMQMIDYLENLGYKNIFNLLSMIPTKRSFYKMLNFTHHKENIPIIINFYIKLLKKNKESFLKESIITSSEIFDALSQFIFYEVDKSIVKYIKIPPCFLEKTTSLENLILLKHYSYYFPEEFDSFQSIFANLLYSDRLKYACNHEYYNCVLIILHNILTDEIVIEKVLTFCKEYIFYEKYLTNICKLIRKYYDPKIFINSMNESNYTLLTKIILGTQSEINELAINEDWCIKKAIIYKCKVTEDFMPLKNILVNDINNDSLMTDLLEVLCFHMKNNSSEAAFSFVSSNHQILLQLFESNDRRVKYLCYKLIYFSTNHGAVLPDVSLKYLIFYGYELSVRIDNCIIFYLDSLSFDDIYSFILKNNKKTIIDDDKENKPIIKHIENDFNILNNSLFYKIFTSLESFKRRNKILSKCIDYLDTSEIIKSLYILKSIGKLNLLRTEKKLITKKLKELILLSDLSDTTQLLFTYCIYKIMIKIKNNKKYTKIKEEDYLFNEVSEEKIKEIRKIMELIEL